MHCDNVDGNGEANGTKYKLKCLEEQEEGGVEEETRENRLR